MTTDSYILLSSWKNTQQKKNRRN